MKKIFIFFSHSLLCFASYGQSGAADTMVTNVMNFSWTPDGKALCFTAIRSDKNRKQEPRVAIFKLDINTGALELLVKNASNPSVSQDGSKMAYTKILGSLRNGGKDIYVHNFKTRKEETLVNDTLNESSPSWSPDGNKLVYSVMTNREKGIPFADMNLWVLDLQSGKKKQISSESGGYKLYNPAWAPKGDKIVYFFEKGDNHDQIYLTDMNGSFHTNLTADTLTHNYYPGWLGNKILYTQSPEKIILMNRDGRQRTPIEGLDAFWAIYNAATHKIAFLTNGSSETPSQLKIFNVKNKKITAIISKETLNKLDF